MQDLYKKGHKNTAAVTEAVLYTPLLQRKIFINRYYNENFQNDNQCTMLVFLTKYVGNFQSKRNNVLH